MLPDYCVQTTVLLSHRRPVAARDVVKPHGNFNQHAIQGEEYVEHFLRVARAPGLSVRLGRFALVQLCHEIHSAITDNSPSPKREIKTIDSIDSCGRPVSKCLKPSCARCIGPLFADATDHFFECTQGGFLRRILLLRARPRTVLRVGFTYVGESCRAKLRPISSSEERQR